MTLIIIFPGTHDHVKGERVIGPYVRCLLSVVVTGCDGYSTSVVKSIFNFGLVMSLLLADTNCKDNRFSRY